MRLFWTPASPFTRKVQVAAMELGLWDQIEITKTTWSLDWGYKTVPFTPGLAENNPIARIPTLVTDGGAALVRLVRQMVFQAVRVHAQVLRCQARVVHARTAAPADRAQAAHCLGAVAQHWRLARAAAHELRGAQHRAVRTAAAECCDSCKQQRPAAAHHRRVPFLRFQQQRPWNPSGSG